MNIDLTQKTALVTGSTSGIGLATVQGLHEAGATVAINGRTLERVQDAIDQLGGGDRLIAAVGDVGSADGAQSVVDAVPDVDILVNNTGIGNVQPVLEIPDEEWDRHWAVNVMSGVRLSRAYMPGMVERGWGRVVFVSSESGLNIPPEMVHYGVTKLAQLGVARGLAESVQGSGVTVNSVVPGPTQTPAMETFLGQLFGDKAASVEEAGRMLLEESRPTSLLGRLATPEEVANPIVYLSSQQAAATTGATVRVDGGVVRTVV